MSDFPTLAALSHDFPALATRYRLADGRITRRHYLDSAASTLAMGCARQVADELLLHYANTHSPVSYTHLDVYKRQPAPR